jgi:hypothetical protein
LGLVIKNDGLEIHDFIIIIIKFTLYYYVKAWIIIIHDYVIFNAFKVIQVFLNDANFNYGALEVI